MKFRSFVRCFECWTTDVFRVFCIDFRMSLASVYINSWRVCISKLEKEQVSEKREKKRRSKEKECILCMMDGTSICFSSELLTVAAWFDDEILCVWSLRGEKREIERKTTRLRKSEAESALKCKEKESEDEGDEEEEEKKHSDRSNIMFRLKFVCHSTFSRVTKSFDFLFCLEKIFRLRSYVYQQISFLIGNVTFSVDLREKKPNEIN